jgi:adenylylsulfate kinase
VGVPTLLLSGTVGAGKSTIGGEISDVLAELEIPNAFVDLDGLIWQWPSTSTWNNDLMFENLASLWPNYRSHGSTHLILARVLEDPTDLDRYREAVTDAEITVCRLIADERVRVERLRQRMQPGPLLDWHLDRTSELHGILERAAFEDFVVVNDRPVREVALEVLTLAGWI